MRPEKKFKPVRDLNPWPLRYQCNDLPTDRVDKPAGSLSLCWFVINPWSDESMAVHIWKHLRNEYESDPCIDENYSSNSESKAWKKFRPERYLNPWPLRYRVYYEQQLTVNISWYTYIYINIWTLIHCRHWMGKCHHRSVFKHILHRHPWLGSVLHVRIFPIRASLVSLWQWMEHTELCWLCHIWKRLQQYHSLTNRNGEYVEHVNSANCSGKGS